MEELRLRRFSACLLLLLTPLFLSASDTVRLAAEDSWPPFATENGDGISRTIIEKAYAYSDTKVEFVVVPYARALSMVESGEVDGAFNVTKQASTETKFAFGELPLLNVSASFYYPRNGNLNYQSIADVPNGTSIATIIGYEYGDAYSAHKHRFEESRVASQEQIIKLLMSKRVDMAIMFDEVASFTLEQMQLKPDSIDKGNINHTSDIYVAFNKKLADSKKIRALDKGLKAINAESAFITP